MISTYEAQAIGSKSFGWRAAVAALVFLVPFASALERELGVVNDGKLFSFVTVRGLRFDPGRYPYISPEGDCLYHAFYRPFWLHHIGADSLSGAGESASGLEPGWKTEIVYTENEIANFRPWRCCGSYRPSFSDCDWLSYWDCRYEAPQFSTTLMRTITRRPVRYPSEYHAEGRFLGSLAYSLFFDLLSR